MRQSIVDVKVRDLYGQGFCVLESVFHADAISHLESLMYAEWEGRGKPRLTGWGFKFDIRLVPELAAYYDCPIVNEIVEATLQDRPRLHQAGPRLSNEESLLNIGWHHHFGWDPSSIGARTRIERVLAFFYLNEISPETGSLLVMPRGFKDEIPAMLGGFMEDWPGQVEIALPPGSAVIIDSALYHTAKRGTEPGIRYLWGGHFQGWSNSRPHDSDQEMDCLGDQLDLMERYPGLSKLIRPDAAEGDASSETSL